MQKGRFGLAGGAAGVLVQGKGACLSMHGCIVDTASHCVRVRYQAKATLQGCQLSHSREDCVQCSEEGSEVTLDGCEISNSNENGVACQFGGRVVARRVHTCGNERRFLSCRRRQYDPQGVL